MQLKASSSSLPDPPLLRQPWDGDSVPAPLHSPRTGVPVLAWLGVQHLPSLHAMAEDTPTLLPPDLFLSLPLRAQLHAQVPTCDAAGHRGASPWVAPREAPQSQHSIFSPGYSPLCGVEFPESLGAAPEFIFL